MKSCLLLLLVGLVTAEDACHRACPEIYAPVCSTDGHTLPSRCEFEAYQCEQNKMNVQVTVAHEGECKEVVTGCPVICPSIYSPVCGSNGQTYDNDCQLEAASCKAFKNDGVDIHLDHEGACASAAEGVDECPIFCPADWAPVCGSNGKTYSNKCRLEVANCRSIQQDGPAIEADYPGVCKGKRSVEEGEGCMRQCPKILIPVCASNGQTFGNECLFQIFQCNAQKNGDEVAIAHAGACQEKRSEEEGEGCMKKCPRILRPVCASNGHTFGNECLFQIFQCNARKDRDEVVMVHAGPCQKKRFEEEGEGCMKKCPRIMKPVCASNGQTFGNECLFEIFQCNVQSNGDEIVLVHDGDC